MMAQAMTNLIPPLNEQETLDLVSIHSVAGSDISTLLDAIPPFRAPHYNISQAGLIGGGSRIKPGEITLAHKGILFLDEFPEFSRPSIEALRLPLESGEVVISRAIGTCKFPAKFQLVVAMNPCPCGLFGYSEKCKCSAVEINKYQKKISAAILDRIDLHVGMEPIDASDLLNQKIEISNKDYTQEVIRVRQESYARFNSICAQIDTQKIYSSISIDLEAKKFLIHTSGKFNLSARAINKLIKVATTISILNFHSSIRPEDIAEALSFRIRVGSDYTNEQLTCALQI
jgi:magnesium chelatase family protein